MDFFKVATFIGASLKPSLCSAQDLGATGNMDIREKNLQIISFEQVRRIKLTRCLQQSWSGVTTNYDPASATVMTRCYQYLQAGNFGYDKQISFTSSSRLKVRWVFQDQYVLSRRFGSRFKWIISYNISLQETNASKLTLKLAYWPGFFQRKYLDFLHWQNLNISAKEICYEIMDTYQEGRWQGLKDDQVPAYKEYLTPNTTCQICSCVYIAD